MNKKAFTLVELLGTIILLSIIALIALPSVLSLLTSSQKEINESYKSAVINAARNYVNDNMDLYPKALEGAEKKDSRARALRKGAPHARTQRRREIFCRDGRPCHALPFRGASARCDRGAGGRHTRHPFGQHNQRDRAHRKLSFSFPEKQACLGGCGRGGAGKQRCGSLRRSAGGRSFRYPCRGARAGRILFLSCGKEGRKVVRRRA